MSVSLIFLKIVVILNTLKKFPVALVYKISLYALKFIGVCARNRDPAQNTAPENSVIEKKTRGFTYYFLNFESL